MNGNDSCTYLPQMIRGFLWAGGFFLFPILLVTGARTASAEVNTDILFVTQVPLPQDFATVNSTFGNHLASPEVATRGGDLYIRYSDGTLKNLTASAGYGNSGLQGSGSIAVRDPSVYWDGTKAIFSMVVGAPQRYQTTEYRWQLYEITGIGKNETPVITKVTLQPSSYNNVMPIYGTDDRIIFVSDRPHNGQSHLYPQRDEYESTATNTGIWSLNPVTGNLILLDHSPSGDFHPIIDSYGRIIFTRWDHLQRDQQADGDDLPYGGFNYENESSDAARLSTVLEVFPEPRSEDRKLPDIELHRFNHFFPWQLNEDGTEHETLNHVGRHELHGYFNRSFSDDSNLEEFNLEVYGTGNQNEAENFFHISEDPLNAGLYYAVNAPEFSTHSGGQIITITGQPSLRADQMSVTYITHPDTASTDDTPSANHSGLYRDPLPLSTGELVAVHTSETREDENEGSRNAPQSRYQFRLKAIKKVGSYYIPDQALTPGITKTVSYYDPDELVSYSGVMWELHPVEVRARVRPTERSAHMDTPESEVFSEEEVLVEEFKDYLRENNLAVIVGRNVTTRDATDLQQPFNLKVAGSVQETIGAPGKVYEVEHLQLFQGDLVRGYGGTESPQLGRRTLAQFLHSGIDLNPSNGSGPEGSVEIESDGSFAAFVPARRALTWQLTDPDHEAVVRERYWLTFQPGEVRLCTSCHGINNLDQAGHSVPTNKPEALRVLLRHWKGLPAEVDPEFSMTATGKDKNGRERRKLFSGRQVTIKALGANGAARNKTLELSAALNGKACSNPIASPTSDDEGNFELSGTMPKLTRNVAITFYLTRNFEELARVRTQAEAAKKLRGRAKRGSKALLGLCSKLGRVFN